MYNWTKRPIFLPRHHDWTRARAAVMHLSIWKIEYFFRSLRYSQVIFVLVHKSHNKIFHLLICACTFSRHVGLVCSERARLLILFMIGHCWRGQPSSAHQVTFIIMMIDNKKRIRIFTTENVICRRTEFWVEKYVCRGRKTMKFCCTYKGAQKKINRVWVLDIKLDFS